MNKKIYLLLISAVLMTSSFIFSSSIFAQDNGEKPKPDADIVNPLDNVDINIIKRKDRSMEIHSINGVIYKIKVTPSYGPPYYLYDTDGDGSLETRTNREISETTVQQWKIFEW